MKTNFLYLVLLSLLLFSCKGKEEKCEKCAEYHAAAHVVKTPTTITNTNTFLALSDVHIDRGFTADTYYGYVTGTQLWNRTHKKIKSVVTKKQPKFMVYLGDLPAYQDRASNSHTMLQNLRALNLDIPILYLPGNNDSLEEDYHSFMNSKGQTVLMKDSVSGNSWPIINANSKKITVTNLDFNKEFGFYAVDLKDSVSTLKVIALNTVIFSNNSKLPYVGDDKVSQEDATKKQMLWFENKLSKLSANDRVLIMMHIPIGLDGYSGSSMWKPSLTYVDASGATKNLHDGFIELLTKYQPNIVGLLNGHTHMDGLRRIYKGKTSKPDDMIAFSISTPGISVNHKNNPAFKVFAYDTNTFNLMDFTTYYASPSVHKEINNKDILNLKNSRFIYHDDSLYTFKDKFDMTTSKESISQILANQSLETLYTNVNKIYGAKSIVENDHTHKAEPVIIQKKYALDVHKN